MFGIKRKIYYIIALIFGLAGVTVLALKIFKVLPSDNLFTLLSLVLLLGGFAIYLRPRMKEMKIINALTMKYRESFYTELTKNLPRNVINITDITLVEQDNGYLSYKKILFEGLEYKEALKIIYNMLRDFVFIAYGAQKDKETKREKTSVESFIIKVKRNNGEDVEYSLVDNYFINKFRG